MYMLEKRLQIFHIISILNSTFGVEKRNKYSSDCSLIDASYISNPISLLATTKNVS